MSDAATQQASAVSIDGRVLPGGPLRRTSSHGPQLTYGGVSFEILGDAPEWTLNPTYEALAVSGWGGPGIAGHIQCAVTRSSATECVDAAGPGFDRTIRWEWSGDRATLIAGGSSAKVRRLRRGQYAAAAEIDASELGLSSLCAGLSSLVVYREGGLNLHASVVELDGVAVLFIGRSGAGKTTASDLCAGSRRMAHDRAALVPTRDGWVAWGLAGGTASNGLPWVDQPSAKIGAILTVEQGGPVRIDRLEATAAFGAVRSMVQRPASERDEERGTLDAVMALVDSVTVGVIHTELGVGVERAVHRFLADTGVARRMVTPRIGGTSTH